MTDTSPQDDLMPLPMVKRMLALAESSALGCAFGFSKDKKEVLLLIEKTMKPKGVATKLKKEAKASLDPTSLRFGRVRIDTEGDPGTVQFSINRGPAGGTVPLMVRLVKKAAYQGAVFNEDAALEQEPEEDGADAPAVPAAPPPQAAEAAIDPRALKDRLTALLERLGPLIAADPSRKDALLALAKQASAMLATNNLRTASALCDELAAAVGPAASPAGNGAAQARAEIGGGAVAFAKSRLAWLAVRQRIEGDLDKLRTAIVEAFKDEGVGDELDAKYRTKVAPILATLDDRLADRLDAATNAADPAQRTQLVAEARRIMDEYAAFLDREPLLADLDDNPFLPLTLRATVSAALTTLAQAVR